MSAEQIVDAIIADIESRVGLGNEWEMIHPEVKAEIRDRWIEIASTPLGQAVPGLYEAYKAKNEAEGLRQIPGVEEVRRRYASPEQFFENKAEEADEREAERWAELGLDPNDWGDR